MNIAGPGFINFYMDNSFLREVIQDVLVREINMEQVMLDKGKRSLVENHVSGKPDRTLHLGHARGAAVGDRDVIELWRKQVTMCHVNTILMMLVTKLITWLIQ